MDKELTVPKWVLINWLKIPQNLSAKILRLLVLCRYWHLRILKPRALFYRTDCTRRSKFLTHALYKSISLWSSWNFEIQTNSIWNLRADFLECLRRRPLLILEEYYLIFDKYRIYYLETPQSQKSYWIISFVRICSAYDALTPFTHVSSCEDIVFFNCCQNQYWSKCLWENKCRI